MIKLTKLLFTSMMSVCLLSGCSSSSIKEHTVNFYNGSELYLTQTVKNGECASEPESPTQLEKNFVCWCSDQALHVNYNFSTPVVADLSLYALFENAEPFTDFSEYHPVNGPFLSNQHFFDGDKDIQIILSSDGVEMYNSISNNQVLLSGAFEDLKVSNVTSENQVITICTTGLVKKGTGYVSFSKATNKKEIFLTMPLEVNEKQVPTVFIDKSSYTIVKSEKDIIFSVYTEYQSLVHGEMTPEEYLEKIKDGTYNYFSLTENENYEFNVTGIHDDFNGFDAKVHFKGDFNEQTLSDFCNNIKFNIAKEALDDGQAHELIFECATPQTVTSLLITPMKKDTFRGDYRIHAVGSRISQSFVDNVLTLLTEPNNKNLFITIPDAEVVISSINVANDYEIYGKIDITTQSNLDNASVSLNEIKIGETVIDPLYKLFADEKIDVAIESTPVIVGYDPTKTGTINQDEGASYLGIKSYIQNLALDEDEDSAIDDLIFIGTTLGKIAYGVYSGDYAMAGDAVGKAFGLDFLRNPSLLMLDRLAEIMDKLQEIENRIQEISEKIEDLKKELEEVGQQTVLNTFLEAYTIWNTFKSQYYAPMMDEVRNYTTAYYRYYYNFAIASHPDSIGEKATLNIYYDATGNLLFPADNLIYSVDGKIIDKSKTKTIVFPELNHTLAGIRHNDGHAYTTIENDIITDLTSYRSYSDDELSEILKSLTYYAMKSYFSSQATIDSFTNTFRNFCEAMTASDIVSSVSIAPLECFSILLKTVFNFGFEIEPDLNLVAVKLQSAFYAAKKIFDFVVSINSGDIDANIYENLISKVVEELTSTRFYRSNDEHGNVFSFVTNCYIEAATKAYGIQFTCDSSNERVKTVKIVADDFKNLDAEEVKDFVSVTEEDLAFMKIKVEIYNLIKGTNYSFKGYLCKIGIIPKELLSITFGILTKIDGIINDEDDIDDLSHPGKYHQASFDSPNATPEITYNKYDSIGDFYWDGTYVYGLKGKMISFDTGDSYQMLVAFTATHMQNAYGDYNSKPLGFFGDGINIGYFYNQFYDAVCVWAYYVSFRVVQTDPGA